MFPPQQQFVNYDPHSVYPYGPPMSFGIPYPPVSLPPGAQPVIPDLGPPSRGASHNPTPRPTKRPPKRHMRMPEPDSSSSSSDEDGPVIPSMPSPHVPVIPRSHSRSHSRNGPVTPGPSFPLPQVIPPEMSMPEPRSHTPGPRLSPGQYGPRGQHPVRRATTPHSPRRDISEDPPLHANSHSQHHRSYSQGNYPRYNDAHLREDPRQRNPLPTPPQDIFERSPYIRLLDDLKRPPEETTLRNHRPGRHEIIIGPAQSPPPVAPPPAPTPVVTPEVSHQAATRKRGKHSDGPPYIYDYNPAQPSLPPVRDSPRSRHRPTTPVQVAAPPSPAPSHHSRRSIRDLTLTPPGQRPAPPPIVVKHNNEYGDLTPYSAHSVHYREKTYPTAYHLFEAFKFLEARPDIAERIRRAKGGGEVRGVVEDYVGFTPSDWEDRAPQMMDLALYHKFLEYPELRELLLRTEGSEIVFDETDDEYWGLGIVGNGANELGKSLVRVREKMRNEYNK
ncbi:hypothetical protein NLI96_g13001 [Meripilus lineatus]|uniref:NADAR domain-containing protein n=1 Tax=Meripilus lineatus TaxID=2056292 RepID=A0AAD5UQ66_9APHY|nr:hypothetical protein NLI96_g13001 [Physisporinus lineatus]